MTAHAFALGDDSKISDVFRAIREAGGRGMTPAELQLATGHGAHQTAPLLFVLERAGLVARAGLRGACMLRHRERDTPRPGEVEPRPWPLPVYVTARVRSLLGPAAGEIH